MKKIYTSLIDKGWSKEEIDRAMVILKYGKSNQKNFKTNWMQSHHLYWIGLIITILMNTILSILLVPFLVVIKHSVVYIFIILFATGFGYVFNFILHDIEIKESRNPVISWLLIPAMAVINSYVIVDLTNHFFIFTGIRADVYNPLIVSIVYILAFMVPYLHARTPHLVDNIIRKTYHMF